MGTTRAQRKLFFGLRREIRKLAREPVQLHAATAELIAHRLDVAPREVIEMDCRLGGDISLNKPINDGEGRTVEWSALLVDSSPSAETTLTEGQTCCEEPFPSRRVRRPMSSTKPFAIARFGQQR